MKALLALLFVSGVANAEPICPVESSVPDDVRIYESDLTKENAERAVERLKRIVSGDEKKYIWITVPNSLKMIEGYILRRDALSNRSGVPDYDKSAFCNFMKGAYWYN